MFVQLKHQSASDLVEGGKLVQWTKRMDESRGAIEVMDLKRQKKKTETGRSVELKQRR